MDLDKAIKNRVSVRKFKSKKPDWRDILEALNVALYAPMAGNIFTVRFVLVSKQDKIEEIAGACQQQFISQAQYVVVVCSQKTKPTISYGERADIYIRQQAGAAIQNFLLKLEEQGLSTCWVGDFYEDKIKRIIRTPEDVQIEAVFPIGYALENPKPKIKLELQRIMFYDEWGEKRMKPLDKLEV